MKMLLLPKLQVIKKVVVVFIHVFFFCFCLAACNHSLKNQELKPTKIQNFSSLESYKASFNLNSAFGAVSFNVFVDLNLKTLEITVIDPTTHEIQGFLSFKERWFFKDVLPDSTYYPISEKSFLEYLQLDKILPHSRFIIDFLMGTYPYKNKVTSPNKVTIHIKNKDYLEDIYLLNQIPVSVDISNPDKKRIASLSYLQKGIKAPSFYLPLVLTLNYKKTITVNLSVTQFEKIR